MEDGPADSPRSSATPCGKSIFDRQNTSRALRLLSAQRRLYSDAKAIHSLRMLVVFCGAGLSILATFVFKDARVAIGLTAAVLLLIIGILGANWEKRRSQDAAAVQEEFDTQVFILPWNEMAADHPSPTLIAAAERRYSGESLKDWYPDTSAVARPLDVLICQRSNVGWGASLHSLWATILSFALTLIIASATALGIFLNMPIAEALATIFAPLIGPARELIDMIRGNIENSRSNSTLEGKILNAWRRGLENPESVTETDCRRIQDRILSSRQLNLSVPNWLHNKRRESLEYSMQSSAKQLIEEARDHGLA
ncbi:S-4TM family putative pore-forming effector [Amycolatopsis sp. NPDC005232]|uniref:S-4TM family putative pore-forming effector n=1 Tax=Amycolatopsis sp. NPDC005232 TaxID=3157027 RepID=UPI0033A8ECAA